MDFYGIVRDDLEKLHIAPGHNLRVTALHPLMEDAEGRPVLSVRSPHPSLLFTMDKQAV